MQAQALSKETQDDLMATAHALADAAREATLVHFRRTDLSADTKESDRFDPVTVADRLSEERMRAILAARRPQPFCLRRQQLNIPVDEEKGGTLRKKGLRHCETDALCGTGDDDALSLKPSRHILHHSATLPSS